MDSRKEYTDKQIREMAQPLFTAMSRRSSREEMQLMEQAFEYALKAHTGQWRRTGEPYIIHPIAVARIVGEELQMGAVPVCAAFLHDVVEDTDTTVEQIKDLFGENVSMLVDAVTKQKSGKYVTSKQVDNFRKMLEAINYDIRALLVKLADRLHNMRTLSSMPAPKQMKIAGETEYFFAPLANRLGLYGVKIELENLSFQYRCPSDYKKLNDLIEAQREADAPVVNHFMEEINHVLRDNRIDAFIEVEYRRPFSVRRKMLKQHTDFQHVENKRLVRIVFGDNGVNSEKTIALRIYSLLTDRFKEKPGSMINYIDSPKDNGYQSLHVTLLNRSGGWEEVHISSERMRRKSRLGIVTVHNQSVITPWVESLKETLHDIGRHTTEMDFMEGVVSAFYNDNIMVYTPKGDSVNLPKNATVLDFAFSLHSELGLHAKYARINGRLSSVKSQLHRGDVVEVGTDPAQQPNADWLKYVSTYRAKRSIMSFLRQQTKAALTRCHHCHPLPGDEVIGMTMPDTSVVVHKRDCPVLIREASQRGDSVVAVEFQPASDVMYPVSVRIRAIDRYHLLSELIDCITNKLRLPMLDLNTRTEDNISQIDIKFSVHSFDELTEVVNSLTKIESVDEVTVN